MPFPDEPSTATVVDHRPEWRQEFEVIAAQVARALGGVALAVDHVGSTSVPGLAAKDCVDVQVRVARIDEVRVTRLFGAIGFRLRPEPWNRSETSSGQECRKLVFAPPVGARRCNVHVREDGGAGARLALLFRDYLRADPVARAAWGDFKRRLAGSVPDLLANGQIKAPATVVLMRAAERWAGATGWSPPAARPVGH
ncbi:GrpB family protein [Streptomyces fulvoviolaceus]|uniref:GrpB family protein n=1 Tax=Streptomyces fulvoviolaceus TaxID=285535 RepID=UPI0004CB154E|nr:GrpB family protein [Streptomyces fulvoviolaceus]MCT9079782.1 GrpB family protein [Streptomyces fulvoviolaceus]